MTFSATRIVDDRQVIFCWDLKIDATEHDMTHIKPIVGWFAVDAPPQLWNSKREQAFQLKCNLLQTVFNKCSQVREWAISLTSDFSTLDTDELIELKAICLECARQTEWKIFYDWGDDMGIFHLNLSMEIAKRVGYDLKSNPNHGFVYLVKSNTAHYKIGKSIHPKQRVKEFVDGNVLLPIEFDLQHTIETDNCHNLEKLFHNKYAKNRVRGEWFVLDEQDIERIKRINGCVFYLPQSA